MTAVRNYMLNNKDQVNRIISMLDVEDEYTARCTLSDLSSEEYMDDISEDEVEDFFSFIEEHPEVLLRGASSVIEEYKLFKAGY